MKFSLKAASKTRNLSIPGGNLWVTMAESCLCPIEYCRTKLFGKTDQLRLVRWSGSLVDAMPAEIGANKARSNLFCVVGMSSLWIALKEVGYAC